MTSASKPAGPITMTTERVELAGGFVMLFEKNVPIVMSDGVVLRANVFRPDRPERYPVVMSHGIYGKDVHFSLAFKPQWETLLRLYPGLCKDGSTGRFLRWEVPDPERWVPDSYAIVVVDTRGSGKSGGYLDPRQPRENQDYYELVEWAGEQGWSNGKVGLLGISYLAMNQWKAAALQPPHLAAICPWEGHWDHYRDSSHHGGILSNTFAATWWPKQVLTNQHGNAGTHYVDPDTGEISTGPALNEAMLAGNREDHPGNHLRHNLDDEWHKSRTPDMSKVKVPVLSAGNWGGPGVHLRGNVAGFVEAASSAKWLSMHIGTHFESFYLPDYVAMQKRFFDRYLKDMDNGWEQTPPIRIEVRNVKGGASARTEREWPIARTQWTKLHLDAATERLTAAKPAAAHRATYSALGDGVTFSTAPFMQETEITGHVAVRLTINSSTTDMDIFATLRAFDPSGDEVVFIGAHEPTPMARGWLRASHRKLVSAKSKPYWPYLAHDEIEKLTPGKTYTVDLEIWPTCLLFPAGYRLALTLMGKDFELPGIAGRILHNDPMDRPMPEYGGDNTIMTGGDNESWLLLPIVPID